MNSIEIRDEIKSQIGGSTETVVKKVIDSLVSKEVDRRAELIISALEKKIQLQNDFDKIKPDQESYDEAGVVKSTSWSKEKIGEKNKAKKALEDFSAALDNALNGDFEKLGQKLKNEKQSS